MIISAQTAPSHGLANAVAGTVSPGICGTNGGSDVGISSGGRAKGEAPGGSRSMKGWDVTVSRSSAAARTPAGKSTGILAAFKPADDVLRQAVQGSVLADAPIVPVSARTGDGMAALLAWIETRIVPASAAAAVLTA